MYVLPKLVHAYSHTCDFADSQFDKNERNSKATKTEAILSKLNRCKSK